MNFGNGVSLTWNTSKCGGAWLRSYYPSLKGESLVLEHVIVYLLVMLAIVYAIDFLSSKVISQNRIFEHVFPLKNKEKVLHDSIEISNDFFDDVQEIRSKRARKEKDSGNNFLAYVVEDEPVSYYDAIRFVDAPFWLEAINNELESIMSNHTWELVELPPKVKPISCK